MLSGPVEQPHFLQPFTSGVLGLPLYPVLHLPRTLPQRWLTLQSPVCGPLCASAVCLVSLAASYSPTSGRAVSLRYFYHNGGTDTQVRHQSPLLGVVRKQARGGEGLYRA